MEMHLALSIFLLDGQARQFSDDTIDSYRSRLCAWSAWLAKQGVTSLEAITSTHIRQYLVLRQGVGNSATTVHTEARALRAFCNFCVREGWIAASPMRTVPMPQKPKKILSSVPMADIRRALHSADLRETVIVLLLLDTGIRASELCALKRTDIDLATGAVQVRQGKGAKDRQVYISARTIKALLRYWDATSNHHQAVLTERGQRTLTRGTLRRTLLRIGGRSNVKNLSPHALRRTFAIESLRAGMNLYVLQRLMGHEDIETLRQYLPLIESDMLDASRKFGVVSRI